MSVVINGVEVISVADAADLVGYSRPTFTKWLKDTENKFGFGDLVVEIDGVRGTFLDFNLFKEACERKAAHDEAMAATRGGVDEDGVMSVRAISKLDAQALLWMLGIEVLPHEKKLALLSKVDFDNIDWSSVQPRITEFVEKAQEYLSIYG